MFVKKNSFRQTKNIKLRKQKNFQVKKDSCLQEYLTSVLFKVMEFFLFEIFLHVLTWNSHESHATGTSTISCENTKFTKTHKISLRHG
jgi:hypothetical protein